MQIIQQTQSMLENCSNKQDGNLYLYRLLTCDSNWNLTAVDLIKEFGLPGDRYYTSVQDDAIEIYFNTQEDLVWFNLIKR